MNIIKSLPSSFPDNTTKTLPIPDLYTTIKSCKSGCKSALDRFWGKVLLDDEDECWNWTGATRGMGYGAIRIFGVTYDTHRVSWIIHNGEIPNNLHVLHHCDNPKCVNPKHLFLGTANDNIQDMTKKNRQPKGEDVYHSKLKEATVLQIRKLHKTGITHREIAKIVGVNISRISPIVLRKEWKHI